MRFLAQKMSGGGERGKLSMYCRVLEVSRQGYYAYLTRQNQPWKYQGLAAGVVVAASTIPVHALSDVVSFHCRPAALAGVLGAAVRANDGSPQGRISSGCAFQCPHIQSGPHIVVHSQSESAENYKCHKLKKPVNRIFCVYFCNVRKGYEIVLYSG